MEDFRKEFYNRYVSQYKDYVKIYDTEQIPKKLFDWYDRKYFKHIEKFSKEARILDLGCGTGVLLQYLKERGFSNLYGFDISAEQIKIAQDRGLDVEVADIFDFLKGKGENFDVIFALDFVEHFHKNELVEIFDLVNSKLKNGGLFIIHTPNGQGLMPNRVIWGDITHFTIFTPDSLAQMLRIAGFNSIKSYESGPVSKNLSGAIRVLLWSLIKFAANLIKRIERNLPQSIWTQDFISVSVKQ
jgi:2-polyprenyl-3-methyl-5-hydroxy-6-metoxy-1,4-benzoquinol methylase